MSTTDIYKYVHGETYTAEKIPQPIAGTGFVDVVGPDGITPLAFSAIALFDDAIGTTELTIDVDFEVGSEDARYTALESESVYRSIRILNAAYQSAVFYVDASVVGGYAVDSETILDNFRGTSFYTETFTGSGAFTVNVAHLETTLIADTGCSTITLTQGTGVAKNKIKILNISGGALTVTDGSTTYYLKDDQECVFYFSGSTLCRGARQTISGILDARDNFRGVIDSTNVTEATMWSTFSPLVPDTGDFMLINGSYNAVVPVATVYLTRTNSTTITFYRGTGGALVGISYTITSTASGTWDDTTDITIAW